MNKRRKLSPEGRAAIAKAQKDRWAATKVAKANNGLPPTNNKVTIFGYIKSLEDRIAVMEKFIGIPAS